MKVLNPLIESVLAHLPEAIQPPQLMKAERVTGMDSDTILAMIGEMDPTVPKTGPSDDFNISDVPQGKYGAWLLGQLVTAEQLTRQRSWAEQNPAQAAEQGVQHPEDFTSQALTHDWTTYKSTVKKALLAHKKIVELGQAKDYKVNPDINQYSTVTEFYGAMSGIDPETVLSKKDIKTGKADPLKVPGSTRIVETSKFAIYEITKPEAAWFHGYGTEWCFKEGSHSVEYTRKGPLYVVYLRGNRRHMIMDLVQNVRSSRSREYWKYLAISPYSDNVEGVNGNNDLWEIRDVENEWFQDIEFVRGIGMSPALHEIAAEAENNGGARGFVTWSERGKYDNRDLMMTELDPADAALFSPEGLKFLDTYNLSVIDVDEDGWIEITPRLDTDHPVTIANIMAEVEHENEILNALWNSQTEKIGRVFVKVSGAETIQGEWEYIDDIMNQRVTHSASMDKLADLRDEWKAYVWDKEGRARFKDEISDYLQNASEDNDLLWIGDYSYFVNVDAFDSAVQEANDGDLDQLARDIGVQWEEERTEEIPDADIAPEIEVEDMVDRIALTTLAQYVGFDLDANKVEEEFPESRGTMRRILKGTVR